MIHSQDRSQIFNALETTAGTGSLGIPASDVERARAAYAALPDIRLDKVNEIRARMASGAFPPSAEQLADAILASAANSLLCR